jgi:hypothetical protein
MPFAAIIYDIKPGFEDEVAEVFSGFRRPPSMSVPVDEGGEPTKILSTALFIRDGVLVRVIEYEGDLDLVARYMAAQPGVQEVERRLAPYCATPRDTATVEGFVRTFNQNLLRCVMQMSVPRTYVGV